MSADALLARLEGVREVSGGWRAECPVGHKSRQTVSVSESANGAVLVHCFACGNGDDVLRPLGLSWSDLFPKSARELTPQEQRLWREQRRVAGWAAALRVLDSEAAVLFAAAADLVAGLPLSDEDQARLREAAARIAAAREMLA
ncbi:hypothetical protein [Solimonas soli]|uniref:hypothetical protein n=1 Tax=Solimonas soli TaxID=413479 RepID=UPI000481C02E|nr:hypothetical protein [Solimonas soli]